MIKGVTKPKKATGTGYPITCNWFDCRRRRDIFI